MRQAFADTVAAGGGTITVPAGLGTITLSTGAITFSTSGAISLMGNGVVIDGGGSTNGVLRQTGTTGDVSIDGVTVRHSSPTGAQAGPIVAVAGKWSLSNCIITGNTSSSTVNTDVAGGLLFDSPGNLTVTNCWIYNNSATDTTQSVVGGAIDDEGAPVTIIQNSSFTGNSASGGAHSVAAGGVVAEGGPTLKVINSTISNNSASAGAMSVIAGGVANEGPTAHFAYVTVDHNSGPSGSFSAANLLDDTHTPPDLFGTAISNPASGPNCNRHFTSNGYNLEDDAGGSCGFSSAQHDLVGQSPNLGSLGSHGGPAPTEVPNSGSPLIDAIPTGSCQADGAAGVTKDERGVTRPQGSGCDIGAVEVASGPQCQVTSSGGSVPEVAELPTCTPTSAPPAIVHSATPTSTPTAKPTSPATAATPTPRPSAPKRANTVLAAAVGPRVAAPNTGTGPSNGGTLTTWLVLAAALILLAGTGVTVVGARRRRRN
jgi:hypothetical protein